MVFGLFKKKEPVKVTVKGTGETFMCQPGQLLMKAAFAADVTVSYTHLRAHETG